jgi:asparagine synthase (glutamine-hydrolysing)
MLTETFTTTSLPMLLRYEDRNSMAHSIESRVPFLTPKLVEFVAGLPAHYLISDKAVTKDVFRAAMRGIVPDSILDRRDKIGFETPEKAWLTTLRPWMERVITSDAAQAIPALHYREISRHIDGVLAGRVSFDWQVWRWLNLIRWADRFRVGF